MVPRLEIKGRVRHCASMQNSSFGWRAHDGSKSSTFHSNGLAKHRVYMGATALCGESSCRLLATDAAPGIRTDQVPGNHELSVRESA
jgi:hypothetical protein